MIQQEMETSLIEYNKCSEALANLLEIAREPGVMSPDLIKKIADTNRSCNEMLERYLGAYRTIYS